MGGSPYENPMIASFFDPTGQSGLTLEQLKARRAIAAALASKSRDYPNTVGKGIYSLGESIGGAIGDYQLTQAEAKMRASDAAKLKANEDIWKASPPTVTTPPSGPAGPAAAPPPSTGPHAELDPETDLSRSQMAEALTGGMEGSRPVGPEPVRMAALPQAGGIMSDVGQPGATYGGPSPAGPGASMAERPDQAPPAPSAPPPGMAGQGPAGTPAPQPVAGGGVPLAVDAARGGLAQQIAGANQAFNPDAAGPGGPGGGIPPQMLAQVGGFAGSSSPALPATSPPQPGAPGLPPLPSTEVRAPPLAGGQRPDMSKYAMPTEAELTSRFGKAETLPAPWPNPELRDKYNRAIRLSQDPYAGEGLRRQAADAAARISAENEKLHVEQTALAREKITRRDRNIDTYTQQYIQDQKDREDPVKMLQRNQAALDAHLHARTGIPGEQLRPLMEKRQKETETAVNSQEDNLMIMDAIRNGVITGTGANYRLDATKLGAWLTNNPQYGALAANTELMRAKLLGSVAQAVKAYAPVSQVELQTGKQQVGADLSLEKQAIESIVLQNVARNNRIIQNYDNDAARAFGGTALKETYKSPDIPYIPVYHAQRLVGSVGSPDHPATIANFDKEYGPGTAKMVLNRAKLNPKAVQPD